MQATTDKHKAHEGQLWHKLEQECSAVAAHAFAKGLKVPASLMQQLHHEQQQKNPDRAEKLTQIHNQLAELVAPAKPETIMLMAEEVKRSPLLLFMGRVPLLRKMMLIAMISLAALIGLSLSSMINNENMVASMFDMQGTRLLYVQAILLSAAAIGASFAALFKANAYVTAGTYDPKYESSYWVRFVVGLISGIILTQLIPLDINEVAKAANSTGTSHAALRITMALIGGFSANLVYTILQRLVDTVQSFISPSPQQEPEQLKQQLQNQFERERLEFIHALGNQLQTLRMELQTEDYVSQSQLQDLFSRYQTFITTYERKIS